MKGGKQAVGGIREAATGVEPQNDAVDFFYKTQGFQQLFTRVEVFLLNFFSIVQSIHSHCNFFLQFFRILL